jgi:sortase A
MKKRSSLTTLLVAVLTLIATGVFVSTFMHAVISAAPSDEEQDVGARPGTVIIAHTSSTLPDRLTIPAIGLNAHVQHVGITKKGTMAVPTNYTDVGWYRYGPTPGNPGSAVMAGHLDNGFGLRAVFKDLHELKDGDDVYVTDQAGNMFHFKVIGKSTFGAYTTTSTETIFGSTKQSRLNLITCEGTWDSAKKMYSDRLVVFTELVSE